jgi:hypothetical protein
MSQIYYKKGDDITSPSGGVYTVPTSGTYSVTINAASREGYPSGVCDFRGLTVEEIVETLNNLERDFPEVKKAIELKNSKLYKALQ